MAKEKSAPAAEQNDNQDEQSQPETITQYPLLIVSVDNQDFVKEQMVNIGDAESAIIDGFYFRVTGQQWNPSAGRSETYLVPIEPPANISAYRDRLEAHGFKALTEST